MKTLKSSILKIKNTNSEYDLKTYILRHWGRTL